MITTISKREMIVYNDIKRLSTDNGTVMVSTVSEVTKVKGRAFSGIISSLQKKRLIHSNGFTIEILEK